MESIEELTENQIHLINQFIKENNETGFSKAYLETLASKDFAENIKSDRQFIYKGKITPHTPKKGCPVASKAIYKLAISTQNENIQLLGVLLDKDYKPLQLCRSRS